MSNQPQCPIEEIELIPHPMDAWRAALNALIACAPGDGAAIAAHLSEAGEQALVHVNRAGATPGVAKMVDRLMLIGAGRIVGERLQTQSQTGIGSLNRRVTNRLTVVVNGTDYDVSNLPGVLVGNMIRVDPNNMPPLVNRDHGFAKHFQPLPGSSQPVTGIPAARCQPGVPGTEQLEGSPAGARHVSANQPVAAEHPAPATSAESPPAPRTPALAPQSAQPAHQNSDRS